MGYTITIIKTVNEPHSILRQYSQVSRNASPGIAGEPFMTGAHDVQLRRHAFVWFDTPEPANACRALTTNGYWKNFLHRSPRVLRSSVSKPVPSILEGGANF